MYVCVCVCVRVCVCMCVCVCVCVCDTYIVVADRKLLTTSFFSHSLSRTHGGKLTWPVIADRPVYLDEVRMNRKR